MPKNSEILSFGILFLRKHSICLHFNVPPLVVKLWQLLWSSERKWNTVSGAMPPTSSQARVKESPGLHAGSPVQSEKDLEMRAHGAPQGARNDTQYTLSLLQEASALQKDIELAKTSLLLRMKERELQLVAEGRRAGMREREQRREGRREMV